MLANDSENLYNIIPAFRCYTRRVEARVWKCAHSRGCIQKLIPGILHVHLHLASSLQFCSFIIKFHHPLSLRTSMNFFIFFKYFIVYVWHIIRLLIPLISVKFHASVKVMVVWTIAWTCDYLCQCGKFDNCEFTSTAFTRGQITC